MATATVQQIMKVGYAELKRNHLFPSHVRKTTRNIMACRTTTLGGYAQSCLDDHFQRHRYNSYKHQSYPQCASIQIERWLPKQKATLLDCPHYHMIFTLPHDLNYLHTWNQTLHFYSHLHWPKEMTWQEWNRLERK